MLFVSVFESAISMVPMLDKFRFITPLSKLKYYMWHDHAFSQRNMVTKKWGRRGLTKFGKTWLSNKRWSS